MIKVFAGLFQKAAGVSGAEPSSRDRNRETPPERACSARSGIMRSKAQDGEKKLSGGQFFRGETLAGGLPDLPNIVRQIKSLNAPS